MNECLMRRLKAGVRGLPTQRIRADSCVWQPLGQTVEAISAAAVAGRPLKGTVCHWLMYSRWLDEAAFTPHLLPPELGGMGGKEAAGWLSFALA